MVSGSRTYPHPRRASTHTRTTLPQSLQTDRGSRSSQRATQPGTGLKTIRGAVAILLMIVGYKLGTVKFVAVAARKEGLGTAAPTISATSSSLAQLY